jgi:hypothetical protein
MSGGRTGSGTGAQSRPTSDTEDVGFLDSVSQFASGSGTGTPLGCVQFSDPNEAFSFRIWIKKSSKISPEKV